jgi:hypothetical protein
LNGKVSCSNVVWFERYKKKKLFLKGEKASMDLDAPMNIPDEGCAVSTCSENPL